MAGDKEVEYSKGNQQGAKGKANGFATFIWNGETGEFLGRSGKSWALIGIYYLIFYCCLAGFFAANLMVFFMGISDTEPKLQGYDTLLKGSPGMGFRPMPNDDNTLISFEKGALTSENYKKIIANFDTFLEPYSEKNQNASHYQECEFNKTASEGKVCRFHLDKELGPCSKETDYGYKTGNPCVLLKLNKIFSWKPKQWSNDTEKCSKELCPHHEIAPQFVGVTCEGESDADKDFIKDMQFFPKEGFSASYYPYQNQKGYLAPLVAVQFKVQPGTLVMVWCKAWADNIYRHKNDRAGSVHFELKVDLQKV